MTASEDVLSVTDPFRAVVIFLDAGLFGSFRLPPVWDAAMSGAVLTGTACAGDRGGED